MPAVRLGKMVLNWCNQCRVPVLNLKKCPNCGMKTQPVIITPPGDIRPAFKFDLGLIMDIIDHQFGPGTGFQFLPDDGVVLLNHAPDIDRLDEVIFNGKVQGALKFDLDKLRFRFLPRIDGAKRFLKSVTKGYLHVDPGAVKPILTGSNVLAPGVVQVSEGILKGDEVLVLDNDGYLLGLGMAFRNGQDMLDTTRGLALKVRWHEDMTKYEQIKEDISKIENEKRRYDNEKLINSNELLKIEKDIFKGQSIHQTPGWRIVLKINKPIIDKLAQESIQFIKSVINKYNLPVAVSYSGGKDSLATLLLVLDAGIKPRIFFIDTGLEFPETVENVKYISKFFNLELNVEIPRKSFWSDLAYFGPPGKDYRWCCKTCKLGPTTMMIKNHFPDGVLVFIGQRRYESEQRSKKSNIWVNPWVPGQIGASPIQNWSALHVWLYLFNKNVKYNPLYERGFERIGCWLCPASDLADLQLVSKFHPDYEKWVDELVKYSKDHSFTDVWLKYGLWRWKKIPKGVMDLLSQNGLEIRKNKTETKLIPIDEDRQGLSLKLNEGFTDCKYGLSLEGIYNKELDIIRIANLLNILGDPTFCEDIGYCTLADKIDVYSEGGIVVKGKNEVEIKKRLKKVHSIILRAMECIGCGICINRCNNNSLFLDTSKEPFKIALLAEHCQHCGKCLGPCPVENYNIDNEFKL